MPPTDDKPSADPHRNPELFRRQGHKLIDLLADHLALASTGDTTALPWVEPEQQAERWHLDPRPAGGDDPLAMLSDVVEASHHLHSPRSVGHQVPPPLPVGALADAAAALLNNSAAIYEMGPVATLLEREVIGWMTRTLGLGQRAGGVLTNGGSFGILRALVAARRITLGPDPDPADGKPALLVGQHAHYSAVRAATIMGIAPDAVVPVPTDAAFCLDSAALDRTFDQARQRGLLPFCLVATAGTTATGSFDPLHAAADFCADRRLWLHVDGAHGAAAALCAAHRHLVEGIHRADSVVWDAHKMLMLPALVTGVLFKDADHCLDTFTQDAAYLLGSSAREEWFNLSHQTIECTKNAMALKAYVALRTVGEPAMAEAVDRTFGLGKALGRLVADSDDFELAVEPNANIVCFRHLPPKTDPSDLDRVQTDARRAVLRQSRFYMVQTRLNGHTYLRCTIINPATTEAHLAAMLDAVRAATRHKKLVTF